MVLVSFAGWDIAPCLVLLFPWRVHGCFFILSAFETCRRVRNSRFQLESLVQPLPVARVGADRNFEPVGLPTPGSAAASLDSFTSTFLFAHRGSVLAIDWQLYRIFREKNDPLS